MRRTLEFSEMDCGIIDKITMCRYKHELSLMIQVQRV